MGRHLVPVSMMLILLGVASPSQAQSPVQEFRDCADCPTMVVIPPGDFIMGSPPGELGRDDDEGPPRRVTIPRAFAVGKYEVTRGQYAQFARETNRPASGNCWYLDGMAEKPANDDPLRDWRNPGFAQDDGHPVVCVTWEDAKAYAAWISMRSGKSYRLLTEAEWEYAARAGTATARPWGDDPHQGCAHANVRDRTFGSGFPIREGRRWAELHECNDSHVYTARVGQFYPNRFGLHDMMGNVWEWVEDCWNPTYAGAPTDGSAWQSGDCSRRVNRGGGWSDYPRFVRSAGRAGETTGHRDVNLGFRVSRTLD